MFDNHRKIIRHLKAFQAKIKFLICYGIRITKMIIMGTNIPDFEYINRAISALAATWIFSCVIFFNTSLCFITPPLSLFSSSSTCCCQFLIACSHFCNSASYRLIWLTWDRLDSGSWRGVSGPSQLFSFNFSNWMFALLKGFWKVKWSLHRNTSFLMCTLCSLFGLSPGQIWHPYQIFYCKKYWTERHSWPARASIWQNMI